MEICGRDISQMDELDWVPIEQATDTEPFLYVSKATRLWALIPFLYSAWFLLIFCVFLMFFGSEGDREEAAESIPTLSSVFVIAAVWIFLVYKSRNEKQQTIKRIATDIEKPTNGVDGVYLLKSRNHFGIYDGKDAEVLLQTKYDFIEKDEYELYFVIKDGKCGLYDSEEKKFVLNCSYDEILDFDTDNATVLQSGVKKEVKLKRNK